MKTEIVLVVVEMEVTYDEKREGAREHIINRCTDDISLLVSGAGVKVGPYSIRTTGDNRIICKP